MLHFWHGNDWDLLTDRLVANLGQAAPAYPDSVFHTNVIAVPNNNIATYLRFGIAGRLGIAANLKFSYLDDLFEDMLVKSAWRAKVSPREELQGILLSVFAERVDWNEAGLARIAGYLDSSNEAGQELRAFQLAGKVAGLFEEYAYARPDILRHWQTRDDPVEDPTEQWQRALWRRVRRWVDSSANRTGRRLAIADRSDFALEPSASANVPAHFFGFSYISRAHQALLDRLGRERELHLYTFLPFVEFADDIRRLAKGAGGPVRLPVDPPMSGGSTGEAASDSLALDDAEEPPAIRYWARPGREYMRLLRELPAIEFHPEQKLEEESRPNVLRRLQRDVLLRQPFSAGSAPDDSLRILACPGIQRELEIVADEIWALIKADSASASSASERLRFNDIAVVLADAGNRAAYEAQVRYVFQDRHDLPFNTLDFSASRAGRCLEAVRLLLDLPLGECTRPEVLRLLTHPALGCRFPEADPLRWQSWCVETNVFRGASRADLAETYLEKDLFHWEQGIRRVALGAFMTGPRSGDEQTFHLGAEEYIPQELAGGDLENGSLYVVLLRSLLADVHFAKEARLPLARWSRFLGRFVSTYLAGADEDEERLLGKCLAKIALLRDLDVDGREISYRTAAEFLRQGLDQITEDRGHYLADGVVVSAFLPMRALPFRVIFVCGLGEGCFPAPAISDPLDLRERQRRLGDVSPRERDKYLFLETLACARDALCLSYVARDSRTGDALEPSSIVKELLHVLGEGRQEKGQASPFVKVFPLHPEPASLDTRTAAEGEQRARELRRLLAESQGQETLCPPDLRAAAEDVARWMRLCPLPDGSAKSERVIAISFATVRRFLECPLQGWARLCLRMQEDDREDLVVAEDEPFVLGRMQLAVFLRDVFWLALESASGKEPDFDRAYEQKRSYGELLGTMPTGIFGRAAGKRHREILATWFDRWRDLELPSDARVERLRFGRTEENATVGNVENPIILPGKDDCRIELFGATEAHVAQGNASISLIAREKADEKDYLRGHLDQLVLAAAGRVADVYRCHVLPHGDKHATRSFAALSEEDARAHLGALVGEMMSGPHAYLLPCEAVFGWRKALDKDPAKRPSVAKIVRDMMESGRLGSSQYGPVPHPGSFEPPPDDVAESAIERRFRYYFQGE